jgi:hypothetical protein
MSSQKNPKPECTKTEKLQGDVFISNCSFNIASKWTYLQLPNTPEPYPSNWLYSQAMLISTVFQKRMEAVERRIVMRMF